MAPTWSEQTAALIRRLRRRANGAAAEPDRARVVAVASGKGGTGKSFVATSLAIALSRSHRVVLVDCDYGLGNDHLLFGTSPERSLRDVVAGRIPPDAALVDTGLGPWLLAGCSGVCAMASLAERELTRLGEAFDHLARRCDYLVLDLAAGLDPQTLMTLLIADTVVLVTNPDIAALTDAYAVVKCLARCDERPTAAVVVNRVWDPAGEGLGERTFAKLAEVAAKFSAYPLHYLGAIAEDPAVSQRRLGQPPLVTSHPRCHVAAAIHRIADRLERLPAPAPTWPVRDRWRRLAATGRQVS